MIQMLLRFCSSVVGARMKGRALSSGCLNIETLEDEAVPPVLGSVARPYIITRLGLGVSRLLHSTWRAGQAKLCIVISMFVTLKFAPYSPRLQCGSYIQAVANRPIDPIRVFSQDSALNKEAAPSPISLEERPLGSKLS